MKNTGLKPVESTSLSKFLLSTVNLHPYNLLAAYDREGLQIPSPEGGPAWQWGWTKNAETLNGRLAMVRRCRLISGWLTLG